MDRLAIPPIPAALKPRSTSSMARAPAAADAIPRTLDQVKLLVSRLDQRFQEISSITGLINGLSKHSNLLALNAAIEAARAGEAGRGFTVVADEVRRLSERTSSATTEISGMISSILQESTQAVNGVEQAERDSIMQMAAMLAERDAARLERRFARMAASLHGIKFMIQGIKERGDTPVRAAVDAMIAECLRHNDDLLAFSCGCEAQAFDGMDSQYASTPGHDASGRYIPYWHRGNGAIQLEALANYDKPGENDFYEHPRRTQKDVLMEPYLYPVGGKPVLMTSLMSPIQVKGRFIGVVGADYALEQLQQEFAQTRPFGIGAIMLVSNQGVYVTHPDPEQLGKLASDLPEHALEAIRGGKALRFVNAQRAWVFQPLRIGGVETAWSMVVTFDLRAALG